MAKPPSTVHEADATHGPQPVALQTRDLRLPSVRAML